MGADVAQQFLSAGLVDEPLFPGAREAIEQLSDAGMLLGVATGKSTSDLEDKRDVHPERLSGGQQQRVALPPFRLQRRTDVIREIGRAHV